MDFCDPQHRSPGQTSTALLESPADAADDPATLVRFIVRLAADGLWMHQSAVAPLAPELRRRVVEQLVQTIVIGADH